VTILVKDKLTVAEFANAIRKADDSSQLEVNALIGRYSKRIQQAYEGVLERCLLSDGELTKTALGKLVGEFAEQWCLLPREVMSLQLYEFTETLYINSGGKYDRWQPDSPEPEIEALPPNGSSTSADRTSIAARADRKPSRRKKAGHRRTTEELFKAALRTHHKYETGGSVLNFEPISTRKIEELTSKGLSDTTAARLLTKHFGDVEKYREACFSGAIGPKLVLLFGDSLRFLRSFDPSERDVEDSTGNDFNE
jgi:hypothetical protein